MNHYTEDCTWVQFNNKKEHTEHQFHSMTHNSSTQRRERTQLKHKTTQTVAISVSNQFMAWQKQHEHEEHSAKTNGSSHLSRIHRSRHGAEGVPQLLPCPSSSCPSSRYCARCRARRRRGSSARCNLPCASPEHPAASSLELASRATQFVARPPSNGARLGLL